MKHVVILSHGLLALYLASLLSVPSVQSPLAALVCLTAIIGSQWRTPPVLGARLRDSWPLWLPLAGYAALILAQMASGHLKAKDSDQLLMFLLTTGVLLSAVPAQAASLRRWIFPAAAIGAIGAFVLVAWQGWVLGIYRPYGHLGVGTHGSGAIKLADLAGVLGLFSILMLIDASRQPRWHKVLGVLGALAGTCAMGITQARGAVVGVVFALFVLVLLLWLRQRLHRKRHGVAAVAGSSQQRLRRMLACALGAAVLIGSAQFMTQRFADIGPQYERFMAGDQNSEIGQRLVLWGIAWRAGLHEPLTGVGIYGLGQEIQRQRDSGELPANVLVMYESAHNEYLAAFSGAGVPGLIVVLMLFGGPMLLGARRFLRGQHPDASLALVMLSSAYSAFALTDAMFDRQITLLAYLLLSAWLISAGRQPVPGRMLAEGSAGGADSADAAKAVGMMEASDGSGDKGGAGTAAADGNTRTGEGA